MPTNAKNALDEAHETVRELAMFLVRVAKNSDAEEQDELMKMAAALARLSESDQRPSWERIPTHAGNCELV